MPRGNVSAFVTAAAKRDEVAKKLSELDDLGEFLGSVSDWFGETKRNIKDIVQRVKESDSPTPANLLSTLNVREDIYYYRYTSLDNNLVKVLSNLHKTSVWERFMKLMAASKTGDALLLFTMKGKVRMVITNKPVKLQPGKLYHKVLSASARFRDIYLFPAEELPQYLDVDSFKL